MKQRLCGARTPLRMKCAIALTLTALALAAYAGEPAGTENFFKRAGKVIGHDAKAAVRQAGEGFKQGGKQIGHGTSKAVKDIGAAVKQSAKKTKEEAKKTF
jgi:hypothetical protein